MKCPNCGWEGDTKYCENCGILLSNSEGSEDSPADSWSPPPPYGAAPWNSMEDTTPEHPAFQQYQEQEQVGNAYSAPSAIRVIAAVLAVLIVVTGGIYMAFWFIRTPSGSQKGERLSDGWFGSGSYQVGKDVEPGLYYVCADDGWASVEVKGSLFDGNDQYEGFDTFGYVLLEDDTTLELQGGRMVEAEDAPLPEASADGWYGPGMYWVGRDIPAEEYFFLSQEEDMGISVSAYDSCGPDAEILSASSSDNRYYYTPAQGTFVYVRAGIFTAAANAVMPETEDGWYPSGMYRIGEEIPQGTYYCSSEDGYTVFAEILADSCDNEESWLDSCYFENFGYFTIEEGAYLELSAGRFTQAENAPVPQPENGVYGAGMYLVGRDIPAGDYLLTPDENFDAYYEVLAVPTGSYEDQLDYGWTDGEEQITITVKDGTYLNVSYGTFRAAS